MDQRQMVSYLDVKVAASWIFFDRAVPYVLLFRDVAVPGIGSCSFVVWCMDRLWRVSRDFLSGIDDERVCLYNVDGLCRPNHHAFCVVSPVLFDGLCYCSCFFLLPSACLDFGFFSSFAPFFLSSCRLPLSHLFLRHILSLFPPFQLRPRAHR